MQRQSISRLSILVLLIIGIAGTSHAQPDLTLSSATSGSACVLICPQGDGAALPTITVTLLDNAGNPVANYPFEDIWVDAFNPGDLCYCEGTQVADYNTDANGQTTITGVLSGGGYTPGMYAYAAGEAISNSPLDITVVSPDINCDRRVDLCDLALFSQDLATFNPRSDFNCDGMVNGGDITRFAIHYCHDCGDGYGVIETQGEIGIYFDVAGTMSTIENVPINTFFSFYVVSMSAPGGISGYEFGIDVDTRILVLTETLYPVNSAYDAGTGIGDVSAGIGGPCLPATGPTVLAEFSAQLVSTDQNIPICLRGSNGTCLPGDPAPSYMVCDSCLPRYFQPAYAGCAIVNPEIVSTEHSTWSSVKGLFK